MRTLTIVGGLAAVLLGTGVVAAASPAPATTPGTSPAPATTPAPVTTPAPATTPTPAAKARVAPATPSWTGRVNQLRLGGTATITKEKDGAILTIKLSGVTPGQAWMVDVHRAPLATLNRTTAIFTASGAGLPEWGSDTIRFSLTEAQYDAFHRAELSPGVLVLVTSGGQSAVADITKA